MDEEDRAGRKVQKIDDLQHRSQQKSSQIKN